tara:strand:+ start:311 stop:421 length:111 start_codon:yes stop_codon:yes gene_type:complete
MGAFESNIPDWRREIMKELKTCTLSKFNIDINNINQ